MKWRSIFGKKQPKEIDSMEDYYSQITGSRPLARSDSAPCFPSSLAKLSLSAPMQNTYLPHPSFAMTMSMTEDMWTISPPRHAPPPPPPPLPPSLPVVPRPPTLFPRKDDQLHHQQNTNQGQQFINFDELTMSTTSPGSPVSVAFCPKCHTIVQPITKRRSKIRTNPWLCSIANTGTTSIASTKLATTPGTIADSGISDQHFMSDVSPATSEARSVTVIQDDRNSQYAKVIRTPHSRVVETPSSFSSAVIPTRSFSHETYESQLSTETSSSLQQHQQSDDSNKKRRKKKKHRRKKSPNAAESEPPQPLSREVKNPAVSSANYWERTSELSNSRHHLSNRPLPKVHEDEILMSSSVTHQPLSSLACNNGEASFAIGGGENQRCYSLNDIRGSTVVRQQQLRQRIEALRADKRHLEEQFSQAQRSYRSRQSGGTGNHPDRIKEDHDKQALLNKLASAHRRMDHQIASLMVTWRSLFDSPIAMGNDTTYACYDYASPQATATTPRHW